MNLNMKKTYNGPSNLVFEAWTDPQIIKKWFSPDGKWAVEVAEMNVSVGGKYRIEMRSPDNRTWGVYGEYKEIKANKKLVFTWNTEDVKETTVSVDFKDLGNKTEVSLVHDLLPSQEQVDEHTYGWKGCMENLATKVLV